MVLAIFGAWVAVAAAVTTSRSDQFPPGRLWGGWVVYFLVVLAGVVWLMSPAAEYAWEVLPIASLVQFPWRLLGIATLAMAVVAATAARCCSRQWQQPMRGEAPPMNQTDAESTPEGHSRNPAVPAEVLVICLIAALASFRYTLPHYTAVEPWRETPLAVVRWDQHSPADRVAMVSVTEQQPTSGPLEAYYETGAPLPAATVIEGEGTVETLRRGGASSEVRVQAAGPSRVQFYTYDYPGWQVWMDGAVVPHDAAPPYGLITVTVPAGEYQLTLRMGTTPARLIGGFLSLGAAALAIALLMPWRESIWRRRRRRL